MPASCPADVPRPRRRWCRNGTMNPGAGGWTGGCGGKRLTHDRDDIMVDLQNDFWAAIELLDQRRKEQLEIRQEQAEWRRRQYERVDARFDADRWQEDVERAETAATMAARLENRKRCRVAKKRLVRKGVIDGLREDEREAAGDGNGI